MIRVVLKPREHRRIRAGHPWAFSNEVARVEEPAGSAYAPGCLVELVSAAGELLGTGYYNRSSLIAVRLLERGPIQDIAELIARRIAAALAFRRELYAGEECYRLVYSEGDMLPGLVVDRYGDHLAVQLLTAGMDRLRGVVVEALERVVGPATITLRNDAPVRSLEGLAPGVELVKGHLDGPVEVAIDGLVVPVDIVGGQKTGFFLDQRENRRALRRYARGRSVLDVFCHEGAWALSALSAGATRALGVDASEAALALARRAAAANGLAGRLDLRSGDAFDVMRELAGEGARFDLVVVDPPAFARSKKDLPAALGAYERINKLAVRLLAAGGILATSSCSYHVGAGDLLDAVSGAVEASRRTARLLEMRGQGPDHAGLLSMPEGVYLKCLFLQVL
jgi:23S rRNA (cytosine1962-C5)-methyltransferase